MSKPQEQVAQSRNTTLSTTGTRQIIGCDLKEITAWHLINQNHLVPPERIRTGAEIKCGTGSNQDSATVKLHVLFNATFKQK